MGNDRSYTRHAVACVFANHCVMSITNPGSGGYKVSPAPPEPLRYMFRYSRLLSNIPEYA